MSPAAEEFANAHPMILANRVMEPGEHVVWAGRSVRRPQMSRRLPQVLFGLAFTAFAIFWTVMAAGITLGFPPRLPGDWPPADLASAIFPLFGIPFIVVGLWVTLSAFRGRRPGARIYALSNQRLLFLEGPVVKIEREIPFAGIGEVTVSADADGTGDVRLEGVPDLPVAEAGLFGIENASTVAEEIRGQLRLYAASLRGDRVG